MYLLAAMSQQMLTSFETCMLVMLTSETGFALVATHTKRASCGSLSSRKTGMSNVDTITPTEPSVPAVRCRHAVGF
jgi:hypothetical protein